MQETNIKFKYNGVSVTRAWLEFNYGSIRVSNYVSQASNAFSLFRQGNRVSNVVVMDKKLVYNFGNGLVAYKTL